MKYYIEVQPSNWKRRKEHGGFETQVVTQDLGDGYRLRVELRRFGAQRTALIYDARVEELRYGTMVDRGWMRVSHVRASDIALSEGMR